MGEARKGGMEGGHRVCRRVGVALPSARHEGDGVGPPMRSGGQHPRTMDRVVTVQKSRGWSMAWRRLSSVLGAKLRCWAGGRFVGKMNGNAERA